MALNYTDPNSPDWYNKPLTYGGAMGAPAAPAAAPATAPRTASSISLERMLAEASKLAGIEDSRFNTEYGRLETAGRNFSKGFEADESKLTGLTMGSQFDQIGQNAVDQGRGLRTMLGGRGIDPSSGTAASLANRVGMQQAALKYGAMRNAAMDSYQRRNANRTAQYAQQLNLAQFGSQSPSMINLDSLTNKAEFDIATETANKEADTAKYVARKNGKASTTSAIGGIIGSILGGL